MRGQTVIPFLWLLRAAQETGHFTCGPLRLRQYSSMLKGNFPAKSLFLEVEVTSGEQLYPLPQAPFPPSPTFLAEEQYKS